MKYSKKELEIMLRNSLDEIRNYSKPIYQTDKDVFGKEVRRVYMDKKGEYLVDTHELENWYIEVNMDANIGLTPFKKLMQSIQASCYEKDLGDISFEETENYTCYQLCDWQWLSDEYGQIIKERKNVRGATIAYYATLVKYAIVLKTVVEE